MSPLLRSGLGSEKEALSLTELFDRNARCEGVWGKEPPEYSRTFAGKAGLNTLSHKICPDLRLYYGFVDLVKRTDQRFPEEAGKRRCVYFQS